MFDRIVVGLDAKDGIVATHGWRVASGRGVVDTNTSPLQTAVSPSSVLWASSPGYGGSNMLRQNAGGEGPEC